MAALVERFGRNLSDYKGAAYNETQVRREFIDPLFKSLGWDVDNEQGYAEAYKDVIHEDAIKVGGATKAPDYCFRIGGVRKFFLEAKRPAVPLKEHAESAFQLRRYAWSARLPLSVLTDFEELAVYDCRIRPHQNDRSSTARTMYFTYDQYLDRWDELASVFSREAVLKGSFDRYAESSRRKRGTAEVDVEFLKAIEGWREALARNFALRNPGLSDRELNFAVQRTIDRIIFLRMCEDRGIEHYGQLQGLCGGVSIYPRLGQLFRQADDRYNSSLFYFRAEPGREPPDELTLGLNLDDKAPREILRSLYYPESPYEFSVLPPEILGQVYEQFLGKVIRLTKGHRAKVEEKPEVRKAGGVYYTPTYIVDYIVKHTVGKLLEERIPGGGGQGSGVRGQGSGKRGADHGDQDVPGSAGVAKEHEPGGRGLSGIGPTAGPREVRSGQPDAASSGVDPSQHRRGPRADSSQGVRSPSVDSPGVPGRVGDPPYRGGASDVAAARTSGAAVGLGPGSGQTPERSHCRAQAGAGGQGSGVRGRGSGGGGRASRAGRRKGTSRLIPDPKSLIPVSRLRILDPACGSGSFLLGAYQYLLNWHRDWYTTNDPEKWARQKDPPIYQVRARDQGSVARERHDPAPSPTPDPRSLTPAYRLTIGEKKRILLNNIYGVDIDPAAVEVTKLSLLLKVLEGETSETVGQTLRLFHERALPDLGDNVKCGNSLIGPDFYDNRQLELLDEEERYRINAFDWQAEFPEVFTGLNPGFDAVIGNPPYVRIQTTVGPETTYFARIFRSATGNFDIYCLFVEQSLRLLGDGGIHGFILPHRFMKTEYGSGLRAILAESRLPLSIVDFDGYMVFENASINTCILLNRKDSHNELRYFKTRSHNIPPSELASALDREGQRPDIVQDGSVELASLGADPWSLVMKHEQPLWESLNALPNRLQDVATAIFQGLKTGADRVFIGEPNDISGPLCGFRSQVDGQLYELETELLRPLVKGGEMRRYHLKPAPRCVLFPYVSGRLIPWERFRSRFPGAADYLRRHQKLLESRDRGKMAGASWYGYSRNQALTIMPSAKILTPDYYAHACFAYDPEGHAFFCGGGAGGYGIVVSQTIDARKILGALNSRLLDWYLHKISMRAYQTAMMYTKKYLV